MADEPELGGLAKAVAQQINATGFGLQYAAVRSAAEDESKWSFVASELSVSTRGQNTHIDFILSGDSDRVPLCVECKRVWSKFNRWAFFTADYWQRGRHERFVADHVMFSQRGGSIAVVPTQLDFMMADRTPEVHVGLVAKDRDGNNEQKGEADPREAINQAADQALLGVNGLVEHFHQIAEYQTPSRAALLIPVVVTSAKLFHCKQHLSEASLEDGELKLSAESFKEVEWLYFQRNQSPLRRHERMIGVSTSNLHKHVELLFKRTVIIVSATSFAQFLAVHDPVRDDLSEGTPVRG